MQSEPINLKSRIPTRTGVYWVGDAPAHCDCCGIAIHSVFVDGITNPGGVWGSLHPACHAKRGRGLGVGLGQRYERQTNGRWLRTEG